MGCMKAPFLDEWIRKVSTEVRGIYVHTHTHTHTLHSWVERRLGLGWCLCVAPRWSINYHAERAREVLPVSPFPLDSAPALQASLPSVPALVSSCSSLSIKSQCKCSTASRATEVCSMRGGAWPGPRANCNTGGARHTLSYLGLILPNCFLQRLDSVDWTSNKKFCALWGQTLHHLIIHRAWREEGLWGEDPLLSSV
jgi:hypothetical protein